MGLKDTDKVDIREPFGIGPIQDQLANFAKDNSIYLIAGTIPLARRIGKFYCAPRAIENQCYAQGGGSTKINAVLGGRAS